MAKASYWELLKHPKWQAKRLEVMERAEFACEWCGDEETTLHVHHTYYEKGAKPWEYPSAHLLCLCADCHERADYLRENIGRLAGIATSMSKADAETIIGYIRATIAADEFDDSPLSGFVTIEHAHDAWGVADFLRVEWEGLLKAARQNESDGGERGVFIHPKSEAN